MELKLDLIDLDQELPGQRRFISCWTGRSDQINFIVDPGPPSTADYLIGRLEEIGLERLDHILLTHIHLDHGGATARILERWPEARVHSHQAGHKHLVDPGRLWEGSRQVLGKKAEVYGEPRAVPARAIVTASSDVPEGLHIIPTPGHAPHHLAFIYAGNLFAGEAAGTFSSLGKGPQSREYYLRPATPPRFFLPVASESLDRLLKVEPPPDQICFAHHGHHAGNVGDLLQEARDQLHLWVQVISTFLQEENRGQVPESGPELEALLAPVADKLKLADPRFARGRGLPADIQERESDFTRQTLRGMLGYLGSLEG